MLLTGMINCASKIAFSQQSGSYIYSMHVSMKRCLLQSTCHNVDLFLQKHRVATKLLEPFAFHLDALPKRNEDALLQF